MQFIHYATFLLLLGAGSLLAQSPPPGQVGVLGTSTGDSILLRWAPTDLATWEHLIAHGVYVDRYTLQRGGKLLPLAERSRRTRLTPEPLGPLPEEAFGREAPTDRYIAIGGQSIYGDDFTVTTGDPAAAGGLVNRARAQANRYGFGLFAADQSWRAATMMGLALADGAVEPDATYVYRVVPAVAWPALDTAAYGFVTVRSGEAGGPPKIGRLAAQFGDRVANVGFDVQFASDFYTGYYIERSVDGQAYRRVNDLPFVPVREADGRDVAIYVDSLPDNNRPYFYRVVGVTPFGRTGPPSDPVQGMGLDPLPDGRPSIAAILEDEAGGLEVRWNFAVEQQEKIQGFRLRRAPVDDGTYEPVSELLGPEVRRFTDERPLPANYYVVTAYDAYGRPVSSVSRLGQPNDTVPPAIPTHVRGAITREGEVIVTWDPNTEADLLGYRLFFSNQPEAEYTLGSNQPEAMNFYRGTTTLQTLSQELYVKVVALDVRHNTSALSTYAVLQRPDTIPPAPPLLTDYAASTDGLTVYWASSESADLSQQELYRRPAGRPDSAWTLVAAYPLPDSVNARNYRDAAAPPGVPQDYRLDAVDRTGLRSHSNVLTATVLDDFVRAELGSVRAVPDRRERTIELSWTYRPDNPSFARFEILRQDAAGDLVSLAVVAADRLRPGRGRGAEFSFTDEGPLRMETPYTYRVRALYDDGGRSPLSDPVTVNY